MSLNFIFVIVSMLVCFIVPSIWYKKTTQSGGIFNRQESLASSAFLPIFIPIFACFVLAYFFFYTPTDFVNSLSPWQVLAMFGGGITVYLFGYFPKLNKFFPLIILFFASLCTILAPSESLNIFSTLPVWANRLFLIFFWTTFSLAYRYTNTGNSMLAIQSSFISLGIGLLGLMGALPFMVAFGGWISFAGFLSLLVFAWYPSRVSVSANTASAFGFLIFAIASLAVFENAISCIVIFSMFFFVDFVWSWVYKLSFIEKFANVYNNTAFAQAVDEGMHPAQAALFSIRIQFLLLFFGCFQVYSPIHGSLIILSLILCIWLTYKFRTLSVSANTIKEINAELLDELQQQVDEVKKYMGRDENGREDN